MPDSSVAVPENRSVMRETAADSHERARDTHGCLTGERENAPDGLEKLVDERGCPADKRERPRDERETLADEHESASDTPERAPDKHGNPRGERGNPADERGSPADERGSPPGGAYRTFPMLSAISSRPAPWYMWKLQVHAGQPVLAQPAPEDTVFGSIAGYGGAATGSRAPSLSTPSNS